MAITLKEFRDRTRHLPPDTKLGITWDRELGGQCVALRAPDSNGGETVIDCGELEPLEDDHED